MRFSEDLVEPIRYYCNNGLLWREEWYVDGYFHRVDGPAWQEWGENGQLEYEVWWVEGKVHRVDGPALQARNEDGKLLLAEWFIDNKRVEPISDSLAWALWIAGDFGDVPGLEKFISKHISHKAARTILTSAKRTCEN